MPRDMREMADGLRRDASRRVRDLRRGPPVDRGAPPRMPETAAADMPDSAPSEALDPTPSGAPDTAAAPATQPGHPEPAVALEGAAIAFCRVILAEPGATAAAQDALAALRRSIGNRPVGLADAGHLLAVTRLMAAVSLPDRSTPSARRQVVLASIGSGSQCSCREAAALLAARVNGRIDARELAALDEHLGGCEGCRALEAALVRSEAAFRDALPASAVPSAASASRWAAPAGAVAAEAAAPPESPADTGAEETPGGSRGRRERFANRRFLFGIVLVALALAAGLHALRSSGGAQTGTIAIRAAATQVNLAPTHKPAVQHRHSRHTTHSRRHHRVAHRREAVAPPVTTTPSTGVSTTGATTPPAATTPAAATQPTAPATTPSSGSATSSTSTSKPAPTRTTSLPPATAPQSGIGSLTGTTP